MFYFLLQKYGVVLDEFSLIKIIFVGLSLFFLKGKLFQLILVFELEKFISLQQDLFETIFLHMSKESNLKYQEESIKIVKMQGVDSLYFSMLNQRQQILNEVKFNYGGVKYRGAEALEKFYEVFANYTINNVEKDENNEIIWDMVESKIGHSLPLCGRNLTIDDSIKSFLKCYNAIVKYGSQGLSAYFSYIYSVIKLVDECKVLSNDEKYTYICLLRNQMSYGELLMLFYYCLSGVKKYKDLKLLIERYAFFENLPKDKVLTIIHLDWYSESAYEFYSKD